MFSSRMMSTKSISSLPRIFDGRPWEQQYNFNNSSQADITGWSAMPNLPTAKSHYQIVVTKNYAYLLGGLATDSTFAAENTITRAPINPDGTLGTWTVLTDVLPKALFGGNTFLTKTRVYYIGGGIKDAIANNAINTVFYAPINSDGALGAWVEDTSHPLPEARVYGTLFVANGRVNILTGRVNTGADVVNTIYSATINSDGTIGGWSQTSYPIAVGMPSAIVTLNRVYIAGGYNAAGIQATVYTTTIASDGTLGTWVPATNLPTPLSQGCVIVIKSRAFLVSGYNGVGNGYQPNILTAPINLDGTLGAWTTGSNVTLPVFLAQVLVTSSKLYIVGGYNAAPVNQVYSALFSGGLNEYSLQ
jgi:hypothetical protein